MVQALSLLGSSDAMSIVLLFWYTVLLELPRYTIGSIIVAATALWSPARPFSKPPFTLSVVLAGHNEAGSLCACVDGLAEQTILLGAKRMQVIVVDDGSDDGMPEAAAKLQREGKIDKVLRLRLRGARAPRSIWDCRRAPATSSSLPTSIRRSIGMPSAQFSATLPIRG